MSNRSREVLFKRKLDQIEPTSGAHSGNGVLDTEIRRQSFEFPNRSERDIIREQRVKPIDPFKNGSIIEPGAKPSRRDRLLGTVLGPLGFNAEYWCMKHAPKRRDE